MLRADRNASILAGLLCAPRTIKGLGYVEPLKGAGGKPLVAADFDIYSRSDEPGKELTVDKIMGVLGSKK